MTWRPLLTGGRAEAARAAVRDLAAALRAPAPAGWKDPHAFLLSRGDAGLAVCFGYLDQVLPGEGFDDAAHECLERAAEVAAGPDVDDTLFAGFTGVGWAMENLRGSVLPEDDEGAGDEVDEAVLAVVTHAAPTHPYDLIRGIVGHGVYGLERGTRGAGAAIVDAVIAGLERRLVAAPGGGRAIPDPDGFDVGLAHGMAGVVAWLAAAATAGHVRAHAPLADAVTWLLAQRLPASESVAFPAAVGRDGAPQRGRWAWCYGDPGVAVALLAAARACGRADWESAAVEAAKRGFPALAEKRAALVDAGFCHGACGIAHIYNRLFQATGDAQLEEAALLMFDAVLALRRPGEGLGGYAFAREGVAGQVVLQPAPALLTGAAGVAAVLAAAIADATPRWDRALLTDV